MNILEWIKSKQNRFFRKYQLYVKASEQNPKTSWSHGNITQLSNQTVY